MKITVSPSSILMLGVIIASGNLDKIILLLVASSIHELGHILCAKILSVKIIQLNLSIFGATIKTNPLSCSYKKEAILAFTGPAFNLICALIALLLMFFNSTLISDNLIGFTVVSLLLAFINLLPIKNFDGGRILSCVLLRFFSPYLVFHIMDILSFLFVFILWSFSVYLILKIGVYLSLFIFSGALFSRIFLVVG